LFYAHLKSNDKTPEIAFSDGDAVFSDRVTVSFDIMDTDNHEVGGFFDGIIESLKSLFVVEVILLLLLWVGIRFRESSFNFAAPSFVVHSVSN
jgi:hypothetical protein